MSADFSDPTCFEPDPDWNLIQNLIDKLGHLMNPPTEKLTRKRSKPAELKPLTGFAWVDARYLYPFFTRRITREELSQNRHQMRQLTSKWYQEVREHHHESDYTNEL